MIVYFSGGTSTATDCAPGLSATDTSMACNESRARNHHEEDALEMKLYLEALSREKVMRLMMFISWWEERLRHFLRGAGYLSVGVALLFRRMPPSKSGFLGRAGKRKKGKA